MAIQPVPALNHTENRPVNLDAPDLSRFSAAEIALVDRVIEKIKPLTATQISEWTHGMAGWKVTSYKEVIPYATIFIVDKPELGELQLEQADRVLRRHPQLGSAPA